MTHITPKIRYEGTMALSFRVLSLRCPCVTGTASGICQVIRLPIGSTCGEEGTVRRLHTRKCEPKGHPSR